MSVPSGTRARRSAPGPHHAVRYLTGLIPSGISYATLQITGLGASALWRIHCVRWHRDRPLPALLLAVAACERVATRFISHARSPLRFTERSFPHSEDAAIDGARLANLRRVVR